TIAGLLLIAPGLPLLISILASLSVLRLLPVLALLSIAALLPALAVLALLSAITTPRRRHRLKLTTQPLHLAQRGRLITLPRAALTGFALTDSLLSLPNLLPQLLQALRDPCPSCRSRSHPADPRRACRCGLPARVPPVLAGPPHATANPPSPTQAVAASHPAGSRHRAVCRRPAAQPRRSAADHRCAS